LITGVENIIDAVEKDNLEYIKYENNVLTTD
jgi:hypothetical protein